MKKTLLLLALRFFASSHLKPTGKVGFTVLPPRRSRYRPTTPRRASLSLKVWRRTSRSRVMRAFAEAVRAHNGTSLKPHISEKYSIEGLPPEQSPMDFLMQAIAIVPAPNELTVNSIEPDGDGRVAEVEFRSSSRPPKVHAFHFEPAGKLLATDFFSLQRHGHGS